jgi:hypothetical protein
MLPKRILPDTKALGSPANLHGRPHDVSAEYLPLRWVVVLVLAKLRDQTTRATWYQCKTDIVPLARMKYIPLSSPSTTDVLASSYIRSDLVNVIVGGVRVTDQRLFVILFLCIVSNSHRNSYLW